MRDFDQELHDAAGEISPHQQRWAWCKTKTIGELEKFIANHMPHNGSTTIDLVAHGKHPRGDLMQAAQYCVAQYIEEMAELEAQRAFLVSAQLEDEDPCSREVQEALAYWRSKQ